MSDCGVSFNQGLGVDKKKLLTKDGSIVNEMGSWT